MKFGIILFFITAVFFVLPSKAQRPPKKITVTGTVTDAANVPVPGAFILIDNQKTNSITNDKGFYKVKIRSAAKIIAICTLMNGVSEVHINGRTTIDFKMAGTGPSKNVAEKDNVKDETVNIGYGTMKKKDLTTTVGKIDVQNKKFLAYKNIYDMINGELPGVQVSGRSITIRGLTSITSSTEPLFVVDGIIVSSIDDIPPQMVKSIEVLKGASASIYGSRGSNGVILISLIGTERE